MQAFPRLTRLFPVAAKTRGPLDEAALLRLQLRTKAGKSKGYQPLQPTAGSMKTEKTRTTAGKSMLPQQREALRQAGLCDFSLNKAMSW